MNINESILQYKIWQHHNSQFVFPNIHLSRYGGSEVDALYITKNNYAIFYEIKCSYSDFKADFKKKRHHYLKNKIDSFIIKPKKFIYVCFGFKPELPEIPDYAGCLLADEKYLIRFGKPYKKAPKIFEEKIDRTGFDFLYKKISYRFLRLAHDVGYKEYWKFKDIVNEKFLNEGRDSGT